MRFSLITVQSYELFLRYASIYRFFFIFFENFFSSVTVTVVTVVFGTIQNSKKNFIFIYLYINIRFLFDFLPIVF